MKKKESFDWKQLIASARIARRNAYAPYSKYRVGCALLASDGRVFVGANCENASYPLGLCAERAAIAAAVTAGARAFLACVIVTQGPKPGAPCGGCRQVLRELGPTFPVRCVSPRETRTFDRDALLPAAFTPSDLG